MRPQARSTQLALIGISFFLAACGSVPILSYYGDLRGANGGQRSGPHPAIDVAGAYGDPVIAAADGRVAYVLPNMGNCGNGVVLEHLDYSFYTLYCHMSEIAPLKLSQEMKRGDVIGKVGTSGNAAGVPHIHFQVCVRPCPGGYADGDLRGSIDPLPLIVGCFDPLEAATYRQLETSTGGLRLVLTYPIPCSNPKKKAALRRADDRAAHVDARSIDGSSRPRGSGNTSSLGSN